RHGALESSGQLHALETWLARFLERQDLPGDDDGDEITRLLEALSPTPATAPAPDACAPPSDAAGAALPNRFEAAPAHYWRRWVEDAAPAAQPPAAAAGTVPPGPVAPAPAAAS